jgi:cysteine desulfurase
MTAIYLDYQASTPVSSAVVEAMAPYYSVGYANPHSDDHAAGWAAAEAVEVARRRVAGTIGADASELIFTSGATEANNLAILGAAAALGDRRGRIVVTAIEHKAVLAPARELARRGFDVVVVPVQRDGVLDIARTAEAIGDRAALVSVGAVNNEIGTVQDLAALADLARGAGALFHSDATQALGWGAMEANAAGVDLASFSAHKVGGPKGVGALFVAGSARDRVEPIQFGGGQEDGLRPGTVPTPLCVGFGAACLRLPDAEAVQRWRAVTARLHEGLATAVPGLVLNGAPSPRHPGNLSLTMPGIEADALVARLQPHVAVSRGSACTSGIPEPSHVLRAIGLDARAAEATVRFSTGVGTTDDEVDRAIEHVSRALSGML